MLPADWLQFVQQTSRELGKSPVPTKRHQPKVTRHMSRRQRIAESQTKNPIRAMYTTESKYNATPTKPEEWRGTRSPGRDDANAYRAGKATVQPPVGYNKVEPRSHGGARRGRPVTTDLDQLLKEYGV
jgi:hypothetical protein